MSLFGFKKSGGPHDLEISMAGLKLGSTVLQLAGGDGGLIAALAEQVGLSGHACAVVEDQSQVEAFTRAAAAAGVLVEVEVARLSSLPYDADSFDLVVTKNTLGKMRQNDRVICLQQANRVLRVGGRCLVIEHSIRGGLGALLSKQSLDPLYARDGAQSALRAEGFQGVRVLAERGGLSFTEGTKVAGLAGL